MTRLITEWSTRDPKLAEVLRAVAALPEFSVERMAAEAALHTFEAQWLHDRIGRKQADEAHSRIARKAGRARRRVKPDP